MIVRWRSRSRTAVKT